MKRFTALMTAAGMLSSCSKKYHYDKFAKEHDLNEYKTHISYDKYIMKE